jgi:hypothetical protein
MVGLIPFMNARLDEAAEAAANDGYAWSGYVEAMRAIIREHEIRDGRCRVCTAIHDGRATRFRAPCPTLLFLAAVYSGHPDYQQKWAP